MQKQTTGSRIAVYYELTKPKIWYLLVFTAFGAALTASNIYNIPISIETWALMLFSVASGSAAANTLTNYHDRDIDVLKPGFKKLKNITKIPTFGTIPLIPLNLPEEDSLNAKPKHITWSKKNILKIDDELNKLSKIVESNIDINSIEKMLQ